MKIIVSLIALALIAFGPLAFVAPEFAATAFGASYTGPGSRIFLLAMATRDVSLGSWLLMLCLLNARPPLIGGSLLALAIVPLFDAANVMINVGFSQRFPLIAHCGSFLVLVVLGIWFSRQRSL